VTFIETVPEDEARAEVAELYEAHREEYGHVPNFTKAFSLRPEVYDAWRRLNAAIKENMDLRRYELATVAAARRLRSSYCTLAHGVVLADKFLGREAVRAIVTDGNAAGLDEIDATVIELADKVAADATSVTSADVGRLRSLGLSDAEILDVVTAAAVRCFYSKALDALGVEADAKYAEIDPGLRDALTVGRRLPGADPRCGRDQTARLALTAVP
jgi:uncharacterized peroxidase-related enzyme